MITIGWRCTECQKRGKAFVANRPADMDLKAWVDECGIAIHDAHTLLSPGCNHDKLDLLMPAPDKAKWLGQVGNDKPLSDDLSEFDKKFKPL